MAESELALVRRAWDRWLAGDLDGIFELYSDDIYWDMTHFRDWPEPVYRGKDGVRRFLDEWLEVLEDYEAGVDEMMAAPDGRIVILAWQRGRGHTSGLKVEWQWAQINSIEDGLIVRIDNYDDRAAALREAGLPGRD